MKAYTDLEQSKKLAEFLPLESADGWWTALNWQETEYYIEVKQDGIDKPKKYIPCWSLAALLSVLICPELTQTSDGGWFIRTWHLYHPYTMSGVNPIDVCYEMIIKLKELKIL